MGKELLTHLIVPHLQMKDAFVMDAFIGLTGKGNQKKVSLFIQIRVLSSPVVALDTNTHLELFPVLAVKATLTILLMGYFTEQ